MNTKNFEGRADFKLSKEMKKRLDEIDKSAGDMDKKSKAAALIVDEIEAKLPGKKAIYAAQVKECLDLQEKIKARELAAASAEEMKLHDQLKAGEIGVVEFHEKMGEHSRAAMAGAAGLNKEIEKSISTIRELGLEIYQMEQAAAVERSNYFYFKNYPAESGVQEFKKMLSEMSFKSQSLANELYMAQAQAAQWRDKVDRARGQALASGWNQDELTLPQIKALLFLPEIPAEYLESLAATIIEIESNEKRRAAINQDAGIYYIALSFAQGKTAPWSWLCRNENSAQIIRMSKQVEIQQGM